MAKAKQQAPKKEQAPKAPGTRSEALPRMLTNYRDNVMQQMTKEFDYGNTMEVPRVAKVIVNVGIGEAKDNDKALDAAVGDVVTITGQKPALIKARKSVAAFKLRAGQTVGIKTTLRGRRMWYFLDKLLNVALPRIRDFRGLNPRSFDGRGNYSMGIREQIIFPEIDYDSIDEVRGLDVTITTTAKTDEEAFALLDGLGMPFSQEGRPGQEDAEAEAEEERRKEEARERAEAEAAALEQLKEENPEAYAKPEKPEEGEEGEEGAVEAEATASDSGGEAEQPPDEKEQG